MILADVHILHQSDNYKVSNYTCHCNTCSVTKPEYNESFCISFVQKGYFEYRSFRRAEEMHAGRILLSKAGYEHVTKHIDNQPDITTEFEFTAGFFKAIQSQYGEGSWFLRNNDVHSVVLYSQPTDEYLHDAIRRQLNGSYDALAVDELVFQLLDIIMLKLSKGETATLLSPNLIKNHLVTIERAKEYILEHFKESISLETLAAYCYVSPFHFSRIFKTVLKMTPHQFLLGTRMEHAKALLFTTTLPVSDIAFECGFNSPEHFVTSFKQTFRQTPSLFRTQMPI